MARRVALSEWAPQESATLRIVAYRAGGSGVACGTDGPGAAGIPRVSHSLSRIQRLAPPSALLCLRRFPVVCPRTRRRT